MAEFKLEKVLKTKGVTQYKLSKLLRVSAGEVFRWCQVDYNPTLKTMTRIADVLEVDVCDLIENKMKSVMNKKK